MTTLCPNKEVCGSCSWSHIPYEKQLKQKLSDINGSFAIKKVDLSVGQIVPSPVTSHYRNRMDFVIDFEGRVGMRMKGKWWKVIDDHTCFISDEKIEALFKKIRLWTQTAELSFFDRKAHTGLLRYAVIRVTQKGESMINIVTSSANEEEAPKVRAALKALNDQTNPTTLIWSQNNTTGDVSYGQTLETIAGPGVIEEVIGGHRFRISTNAFFQTNSHGAEHLLNAVDEFCGDLTDKTLLDLYCGSGFFSVALASRAKKTIGVEMVADAIRDARINAELNDVEVEFHDVKTEEFDWKTLGADIVILDPPRSGMHDKALKDVMDAAPETIIYVSCNPKNFAREMVELEKIYDVVEMRAIDMFPHTPHVELVSKLIKR
ncbi:23S rRNA (uracil(1939)-C(5))-methyltransferase RlmD [Candidatus Uhrbacteria bacterium]|jgi:23S rRNA (uracil1939-C5)-methyltransferase|nr:23S rRNA (uracil(1939)-C(5))-methyltransferase RlmD [Candidatus Uhrbacteria bacterium]